MPTVLLASGGGRERSMKKKHIIKLIVIFVIIVDLFVLSYPSVSNYLNSLSHSRIVSNYYDNLLSTPKDSLQKFIGEAQTYNKTLQNNSARFQPTVKETDEYNQMLGCSGIVMGVLSIEKLDVNLPIYHGTNAGVLQIGLGHLQGSSLPVGGLGSHSIITGHSGLPSSSLLTDLNKMAQGDTFILNVMGQTLIYQVDQIKTVEPSEIELLSIDENSDFCTLVTCTPYGINTHRLLVRGKRIITDAAAKSHDIQNDERGLDKIYIIIIILIFPLIVLITLIIKKLYKGGITK